MKKSIGIIVLVSLFAVRLNAQGITISGLLKQKIEFQNREQQTANGNSKFKWIAASNQSVVLFEFRDDLLDILNSSKVNLNDDFKKKYKGQSAITTGNGEYTFSGLQKGKKYLLKVDTYRGNVVPFTISTTGDNSFRQLPNISTLKNNLMDVCIYYCEETQATSKSIASEAQHILYGSGKYNVYIRKLSKATNAKSGYQITSPVIKYNSLPKDKTKDETPAADDIISQLKVLKPLANITKHAISTQSDWYISVFIY